VQTTDYKNCQQFEDKCTVCWTHVKQKIPERKITQIRTEMLQKYDANKMVSEGNVRRTLHKMQPKWNLFYFHEAVRSKS